jgi:hypothetical protein
MPPPFTISNITYKVAVYAPAERADTLLLYMYSVGELLLTTAREDQVDKDPVLDPKNTTETYTGKKAFRYSCP